MNIQKIKSMIGSAKTLNDIEIAVCMYAESISDIYEFDSSSDFRYNTHAGSVARTLEDEDYDDDDFDKLNDFIEILSVADGKWLELAEGGAQE